MTQSKSSETVIATMLDGLWAQYGVADHQARKFREQAETIRNRIVHLQTVGADAATVALSREARPLDSVTPGMLDIMRPTRAPLTQGEAQAAFASAVLSHKDPIGPAQVTLNRDGSVRRKPGRKAKRKPKAVTIAAAPARRGRKPGRKPKGEALAAAPAAPKKRGRPPKAKGVTPRRRRAASTEPQAQQPELGVPTLGTEPQAFL